jgi:hypothetical protein
VLLARGGSEGAGQGGGVSLYAWWGVGAEEGLGEGRVGEGGVGVRRKNIRPDHHFYDYAIAVSQTTKVTKAIA